MRLTGHNQGAAMELVQEVWVKVLTHEKCDVERLNTSYLMTVLKNHFYDKQRKRGYAAHEALTPLIEDTVAEERENENESDRFATLLHYLKQLKDGWIYQELIDRDCSLKTLSQLKGIKYHTLCQKKRRLDLLLQQRFGTNFNKTRGGVKPI
jgi:hypothetical protein